MITAQAQRTLVKSPPELWTELSDPVALARHLGDLGEIKITRVEPESKVEWEAAGASGVVELRPSGWGTKVTLSVTHERIELEQIEASIDPAEAKGPRADHDGAIAQPSADEPQADAAKPVCDRHQPSAEPHANAPTAASTRRTNGRTGERTAPEDASPSTPETEPEAQPDIPLRSGEQSAPAEGSRRKGFLTRLLARMRIGPRPAIGAVGADAANAIGPSRSDPGHAGTSDDRGTTPIAAPPASAAPVEPPPAPVARATAEPLDPAPHAQGEEEQRGSVETDPLESLLAPSSAALRATAASERVDTVRETTPTSASTDDDSSAQPASSAVISEERSTELLKAVLDRLGEAHHRPFSRS